MASANTASPLFNGNLTSTESENGYNYYDNGTLVYLDYDEPLQSGEMFAGVLYALIFTLSLAGNGFLLWALLVREDLRKTTTLFLLQLTVSDFLLTLSLPFWGVYLVHEWVFGPAGCHLLVFVFFLGFYSYMAFLTAVTIHRYLAVVHAVRLLRVRPRLCILLSSVALWLGCIAASVPEAVNSQTVELNGVMLCEEVLQHPHMELLGYGVQIGLFFLLPLALVLFCYTRIWATVLQSRSGHRVQTVRLIFCMVVVFFACWTPYNIVLFLYALQVLGYPALSGLEASEKLVSAYYVCQALAFCHCFLNPAMHIFGSGRFRGYLSHRRLTHRVRSMTTSTIGP